GGPATSTGCRLLLGACRAGGADLRRGARHRDEVAWQLQARRPRALEAPAERRTRSGSPDRGGRLCLTGGSTTRYRPGGGGLAFGPGPRAAARGAGRRPPSSGRWRVVPLWLAALSARPAHPRPACAVRLDGVRAVAVSADGAYVYAAAEFADAIVVFRRSPATGDLVPVQEVRHAPGGPLLDAVDSVALSPDGRHLYAAAFVSTA